jgi:hypothetical protein
MLSFLKKLFGIRDHLCEGKTISKMENGREVVKVYPCPICHEPKASKRQ